MGAADSTGRLNIETLRLRMRRGEGLPVTPALLPGLFAACSPGQESPQILLLFVAHEPALAARALRTVASDGEPTGTVAHALARIDAPSLRRLVLDAVHAASEAEAVPAVLDATTLWRHTVGAALTARRLAQAVDPEHAETAFTAALLRNSGLLALGRNHPHILAASLEDARHAGHSLHRALIARASLDHHTLARLIVQDWGLPGSLAEAVGAAPDDFLAPPLAQLVLAAESVAVAAGFPGWAPAAAADEAAVRVGGLGGSEELAANLIAFAQASVFRVGITLGLE